jgi:hypothetical protein
MKEEQAGIGQRISEMMSKGLTEEDEAVKELKASYDELGTAINTAQDTSSLQGMLKGLLGVVLDFASEFGKALIAVGIGKLALDKIFVAGPGGAALAIGAGIALMALVGIANAALSGGLGGGTSKESSGSFSATPAFASGGIVPGNSYSGDNVAARLNSGEMVLNSGQQSNLFNQLQSGGSKFDIPSEVILRVRNGDLVAALAFSDKRDKNMR